jgi:hypothetical protein
MLFGTVTIAKIDTFTVGPIVLDIATVALLGEVHGRPV